MLRNDKSIHISVHDYGLIGEHVIIDCGYDSDSYMSLTWKEAHVLHEMLGAFLKGKEHKQTVLNAQILAEIEAKRLSQFTI